MLRYHKCRRILAFLIVTALFCTVGKEAKAYEGDLNFKVISDSLKKAQQVEEEGIVLLKNDDEILPLNETRINVFGCNALDPFLGSAERGDLTTDVKTAINFYDALEQLGYMRNETLYETYRNWYQQNKSSSQLVRNEMPASEIDFKQAVEYSDIAVVMIGRGSKAGKDLDDSMIKLQKKEQELIALVAKNFDKVIVLLNTGNVMEMGFLDEYPSIKAAALIWYPGENGFISVVNMLRGYSNPSGRLADTAAKSIEDHPSSRNFGSFTYEEKGYGNQTHYVEYEEGIYVGYRYFETFGVDVQYPFGHGLSYSTFEWSDIKLTQDGNKVIVSLNVKNTSIRKGKDVVEIYACLPYTQGEIEKSSVVLAGYTKTDELNPGEIRRYEVSFWLDDLASYDAKNQEWVLQQGDYIVYAGRDVKDRVAERKIHISKKQTRLYDSKSSVRICNRFDHAVYDGFTVLSRKSGTQKNNTYPSTPKDKAKAPAALSGMDQIIVPAQKGKEVPAMGAVYEKPIMLQHVFVDSSLEDKFLNQLTFDEMIWLINHCGSQTPAVERLGIPKTVHNEGTAQLLGINDPEQLKSGVLWPAPSCLAATWNESLAYQMGAACAKEAAELKQDVWYAPSANLHRNPKGGHNFDTFSEDPLISGSMSAALIRGASTGGLNVVLKNFVLNEQETNRLGLITWADEQTIRELYLRPFERAVKEFSNIGIMTGYNRIGLDWCGGDKILLNDLLRTEWGYDGCVMSEYSAYKLNGDQSEYMNPVLAIYARNACILSGMRNAQFAEVKKAIQSEYEKNPAAFIKSMRECCRDILHMKMRSKVFLRDLAAKTKSIRVEGEQAIVEGKPWQKSDFIETRNGASNGMVLGNLSVRGNKASILFDADEDGEYGMTMVLGNNNLSGMRTRLGKNIKMIINGQTVDLDDIILDGASFEKLHTYGLVKVELMKGHNTITVEVTGENAPDIDCIDFGKI